VLRLKIQTHSHKHLIVKQSDLFCDHGQGGLYSSSKYRRKGWI